MAATVAQLEELYRTRFIVFRNGVASLAGGVEPAHEIVQEAFARALRDRRRFRGDGSLEAWVWRIAVNCALKSRGLRAAWEEPAESAAVDVPPLDDDLQEALRALPPRRRLVVFLRYFADLPYADIARICGVSEGTVAATLSQSHAELRSHLSPEGA